MNGDKEEREKSAELRQRAEQVLQQSDTDSAAATAEEWKLKRMVHELQVHQVQLVMQNEELLRSRQEIEQSHNEYANLYEFAPVNYFTLDRYGLIIKLNLMGARLLGVERKFLLKNRWLRFVTPKYTHTFYDFFNKVLQTGTRQVCEIEILRHSGEKRLVQLQGVSTNKENRNSNECLLTVTDITALKKAEEDERYLHQFSQIIEGMPGLYLFLSPDLVVLEANKNYLQELQLERPKVIGHKIFEIFAQNPSKAGLITGLHKSLQEVTQSEKQHLMDIQRYDIRLADGRLEDRYWRIVHSPIFNSEGYISYIVHHMTDVTKEFAAQWEIEKNRQRFEMLALASNDIVWEWDLNTGNWWWNRNLEIQFGYNRADIEPGMEAWANRLHPEDKDRVLSQLMQAAMGGYKEWRNEYRFRRADGSYAFVLDRAYTLQDAKGKVLRMLGTLIDITEQKQTELALKKSNERFALLLETIPQMAWMSEPDGQTYFYNAKWIEYLGVNLEELQALSWLHYLHPEDAQHTKNSWIAALQAGISLDMQNRWRRASDGEYRWHIGKILPVRNRQGSIIQWVGSLTDIHDQKLQEESLEKRVIERTQALQEANTQLKQEIAWRIELEQNLLESQLMTKQIVDATPDIVHVYDLSSQKTLYLNYAITHILGYTLEQIQDMGDQVLQILIHPDDQEKCKKGLRNLAASLSNKTSEMEYRLKDNSGQWHWVRVRYAVFIRDAEGQPMQIIGIVHDITEKKKYEERLKLSQNKLKKLNEELEKRVAHRTRRLHETFEHLKQEFAGRMKVQEALQLNHMRFQVALEKSPVILFTQDITLTYTWIHNAFDGMDTHEFIGKTDAQLFPPKTAEMLTTVKANVLQTGQGYREEVCLEIAGKSFYYHLTVEPLFTGGKQKSGIACAAVDITDAHVAKAELARSEQRYRLLTESIPEMIFTTDLQGQLDYANHWMLEFTGLPNEALAGEGWWQAVHPDDLALVQEDFTRTEAQDGPSLAEIRFKRASDGAYIWHLKRIVPFKNPEGATIKWIGISTDIHDQKLVEEALRDNAQLREAERNLRIERDFSRSLIDNSVDGIFTFDTGPCYTSWNTIIENMYGISKKEVIGKKIFDAFPDYAHSKEGKAILRVLAGEKVTLYNQPYETREGSYEINLIPLFDENKAVIGGLGILHDVTERIKLEEERTSSKLKRQKDMLNAILEAQEGERRRIAEALHNGLAQTLYAAKLNLEQLSTEVAGVHASGLKVVKDKTNLLLIDAIKETRSISHELIPTILEDFGLEGAIDDIRKKYIQANLSVQSDIYGFEERERLDKYLEIAILRITQELVNNAVKHAEASKLHITLVKGELGILLKVTDNGKGFDVHTVMQSVTGIGLKTIQDRVKLLNGIIDIQSAEGEGTAITIKIPFS